MAACRFHPQQIEHARRSLVAPPDDPAEQLPRISRVVNWIILRDSRPAAASPEGKVIAFPQRRPVSGSYGGSAA